MSFQLIIDELEHRCYLGWIIPPLISKILLVRDNMREAAARRSRDLPPPVVGAYMVVTAPRR